MSSGKQGTDDFTPPAPQCRAETSATNHLPHGTTRTNRSALRLPATWYSRATRHHRDDGTLAPTNERPTTPVDQASHSLVGVVSDGSNLVRMTGPIRYGALSSLR
jgi:hypothetical protein